MRDAVPVMVGLLVAGCEAPAGFADASMRETDAGEDAASLGVDVVVAGPADVAGEASLDVPGDLAPSVAAVDAPPTVDPATVGPLRLIAPLSTTIVTSRRPTLRWGPMPDHASAHVTLCDDAACARVLTELDASAASVRPATALRPGPVFWRVRVTPAKGAAWESPTWEFFVTPHDSPVDTTRCCVVDVNRDGVPDIEGSLVGQVNTYGGGSLYFHGWSTTIFASDGRGYPTIGWRPTIREYLDPQQCIALVSTPHESVVGLRPIGDVSGDGYGDLALAVVDSRLCGAQYHSNTLVRMYASFVYGGSSELHVGSGVSLETPSTYIWRVISLGTFAAGDVDGDGLGDVGWSPLLTNECSTNVYRGSPTGFGEALFDPTRAFDGSFCAAAFGFDADGDGRHDVASLSRSWHFPPLGEQVRVTTAASTTTWSWPGVSRGGDLPSELGSFDRVGDVDGDGYEDLAVSLALEGTPPQSVAAVFRGGPDGYSLDRTWPADATWLPVGIGGPLFDANGDGANDRLVVSAAGAWLYLGGHAGFTRDAPLPRCAPRTPPDATAPCGPYHHFSAGDFNRDGYSDLYVWNGDARALEVFAGATTGFGAVPVYTTTLAP